MTTTGRRSRITLVVCLGVLVAAAGCGGSTEDAADTVADGAGPGMDVRDAVPPDGAADHDVPPGPLDGGGDGTADTPTAADTTADATDTPAPFTYPCETGVVRACVTVCGSAGEQMCLKDWGPCIPPPEFCGNCVDDNCDGQVNEGCTTTASCDPPPVRDCPTARITVAEGTTGIGTNTLLHLSGRASTSPGGAVTRFAWSVASPAGAAGQLAPNAAAPEVTFLADVAGRYLFTLVVWDELGLESCVPAQVAVTVAPTPPLNPEMGCADGTREGFVDLLGYPQIAGCAGAFSEPGITPASVVPTCGREGGNSGPNAEGAGCSSADLCAAGWHVCRGWPEVAAKSPTGCAGATPADAPPKSLFFAVRQPSQNHMECGPDGSGDNDVFGCGNLGHAIPGDRGCGPLDRALASMQADTCGFNEAEPNLGPWRCVGGAGSHLREGAVVTKSGCPNTSCQYDGRAVGNSDKGGVLCCRD